MCYCGECFNIEISDFASHAHFVAASNHDCRGAMNGNAALVHNHEKSSLEGCNCSAGHIMMASTGGSHDSSEESSRLHACINVHQDISVQFQHSNTTRTFISNGAGLALLARRELLHQMLRAHHHQISCWRVSPTRTAPRLVQFWRQGN